MINEKIFNEVLKQYNRDMNLKIRTEGWMNLSELQLREVLTEEINTKNNGKTFNLATSNVAGLLKKEDYRGLHLELEKVFNDFIPLVTIRRFLKNVERYGINLVCSQANNLKDLFYSDVMSKIKYPSKLIKYLCDTEEEIEVYDDIYIKYNSNYDRLTEYRKSRINRNIGQVTAKEIKNLVKNKDILKDTLQRMFGDFIEDEDISEFIQKVKQGLNVENLLNWHNKYSLEKFNNLLLIVKVA